MVMQTPGVKHRAEWAAGTVLLALRPGCLTLVANAIVLSAGLVYLVIDGGMDDAWVSWGLLGGGMALLNVLTLYPVLGEAANNVPLSRPVVVAMFLLLVGGGAVICGVAAALLGRFVPTPASLGDSWWAPTLLIFAAGAWIAAWSVLLMFCGLLPLFLALPVAIVLCAVALVGVAGPMLLVAFGDEWMVNLAIASPVVTLPVMLGLLLLMPLQRLSPRWRRGGR
ncbi:hypothetical protein [Kytococcus sedentarius]|uniref:hypothetical protein n=1 Tax=Kytococcus sedentarius TaxID=1276 RepID=UPI0035BC3EDC